MNLYIDVKTNANILKAGIDFMCVAYPDRDSVVTWDAIDIDYNASGFSAKCTGVKIDMSASCKLNKDIVRIEFYDRAENRIHVESGAASFVDGEYSANIFFDDKHAFLFDHTKEEILKKVIFRPENRERCKGKLENFPHAYFLDLTVLFVFPERLEEGVNNYITITNDMCKTLHISKRELIEAAKQNENYEIKHVMEKMQEIMEDIPCDFVTDDFPLMMSSLPMYVGTNQFNHLGASILMKPSAFYGLSMELESDLYIFPCSVHEVVIVPTKDFEGADILELKAMVWDINRTEISVKDYLSDNVYVYDRGHNQIRII